VYGKKFMIQNGKAVTENEAALPLPNKCKD
jgi:hypothetical protein